MLKGKKTYITAIVAIVGAIGAYLAGDASVMQTAQLVTTALLGMFLRNGMTGIEQTL
jgi:hypothetical protein